MHRRYLTGKSFLFLLIFSLLPLSLIARPFVLVLSQDDLKDKPPSDPDSASEWDEFGDSDYHKSEEELDPGSWRPIFESDTTTIAESGTESEAIYYSGLRKIMSAVSSGDVSLMEDLSREIEAAGKLGNPTAQSVIDFLYGMGLMREKNKAEKNYTKVRSSFSLAKEYFEKAADNDEVGRHYNLGVMYLKGIGVKRDVKLACKYFIVATNNGQPKAFYQLAKMFHTGVGLKKSIPMIRLHK
ncbi:hypothetical protein K1719_045611 [Acacia pycnantha]|nr:hypothetical protein K1719_045611 [Acacia pycnantha]